jgi:hypothetical protein
MKKMEFMKPGDLVLNIFMGKKEICVFVGFEHSIVHGTKNDRRLAKILLPSGKVMQIHEDYLRVIA